MPNGSDSIDTMRHLYVLMMGLGMRESSGQHCCGRDMSASNTTSDTCEAGLFQTSWNASTCCTDFINLADSYEVESPQGYMGVFGEGVTCSSSSWSCYGSGDGFRFQKLCKYDPAFAVETAGITCRNLRQHYGPINRKEAELRREADDMFREVQALLERAVRRRMRAQRIGSLAMYPEGRPHEAPTAAVVCRKRRRVQRERIHYDLRNPRFPDYKIAAQPFQEHGENDYLAIPPNELGESVFGA